MDQSEREKQPDVVVERAVLAGDAQQLIASISYAAAQTLNASHRLRGEAI